MKKRVKDKEDKIKKIVADKVRHPDENEAGLDELVDKLRVKMY